jgi:hypothetical protein
VRLRLLLEITAAAALHVTRLARPFSRILRLHVI